jgi:hypothetical protein
MDNLTSGGVASMAKIQKEVVIAIIALVGTIATGYFTYKAINDTLLIPINTTQTAEARLVTSTAGFTTGIPTVTDTPVIPDNPVSPLSGGAGGAVSPATATSVPDPVAIPPSLCCLSGWDVFSTTGSSFSSVAQDACPNAGIDEIGIHASNCSLTFALNAVKQPRIAGLSMPIPHNAKIKITAIVRNLQEGEFWIGFSKDIDPQSDSLIYAMTPDPGGVSVYLNNIDSKNSTYPWRDMGKSLNWVHGQPWVYNFTIEFNGANVVTEVDDVLFYTVAAPSTNRLFIGYRSKPGVIGTYLNAEISTMIVNGSK